MTEKHDYRAVLKRFGNGEDGPVLVYQITDRDIADEEEAIRAALRLAIARQEQEEALERGEAEKRYYYIPPHHGSAAHRVEDVEFFRERRPDREGILISVAVPLPQPIEIEAEVEQE